MEVNFDNKNILVTGASAGIGEATALLFAKYGAKLTLVGRDVASLQDVARRVEAARGVKPLAVVADLAEEEGCERTVKETLQFFGDKLDVLVNNAGVGARTNLEHTDLATFDRVFSLNVRGVYNVTRLLGPALIRAKGNIVNVSSVSGLIASVGSLPYSMTKAALDHFTSCIALELAPKGVRVNSVNPGFTVSKFVYRLTDFTEEQYRGWLAQAAKGIPMGQVCESEDIAKSIVFLASDLARLVTGATLVVDGGVALAGAGNSNIMTQQIKK